jgi:hypothetical protein
MKKNYSIPPLLMFFVFIFSGLSSCVVKEYPHHCHERIYVEPSPVVEEKVVVR